MRRLSKTARLTETATMALPTDDHDDELTDSGEERRYTDARIGQVFAGTYRIVRYIGSGGSSHVYEAEHKRLGKSFAVKLLRAEIDTGRRAAQRFRREAKAVARLQSEHIVSVVDCGELDDQTPYLVMELLQGEDLRSLLKREHALPTRRAVQLVIEACRGLTVVHAAGLVHRDLKPENLFLTRRSTGEDWCKVLDFGVAKMEASMSTAQGAIVGTVRYMAPEQLSDGAAVSAATDLYALGAILYECLSGSPLVEGSSVQEAMYRVMNATPVPLRQRLPTVPAALAAVVERCVEKSPTRRPSSARALIEQLEQAQAKAPSDLLSSDTLLEDAAVPRPAFSRSGRKASKVSGHAGTALALLAAGASGWLLHPAPPASTGSLPPKPGLTASATKAAAALSPISAQPRKEAASVLPAESAPTSAIRKAVRPPMMARKDRVNDAAVAPPPKPATTAPVGHFDPNNPYGE
jgi:serine/threonine-protein kinase